MNSTTRLVVVLGTFATLCTGCLKREPSSDICEAINRKDHSESEVLEMLAQDPSVVTMRDSYGNTPLTLAAGRGMTAVISVLLSMGVDVDEVGSYGSTSLIKASHAGEHETVKLLLENGADPNFQNDDGEIALYQVIMRCPDEIYLAKTLIRAGTDMSQRTGKGMTLLEACRDRRKDYADPNPNRTQMVEYYDNLEALLSSVP